MSTRRAVAPSLLVTLTLGGISPAWGVDLPNESYHALPCRPTIACTAEITPPGAVELEVGYVARFLGNSLGSPTQHSTPFLFKLSLAHWVQFQLSGNGGVFTTDPMHGHYFDNLAVGFKLHLLDQGRLTPMLSLSGSFAFPVAHDQLGFTPAYDAFFLAYVTKDIGWLHVDLNVGVNAWRLDQTPTVQGWAALALSGSLPRSFGVMLEGYYFGDAAPAATHDGGILAALTFSPRPWLILDAGIDVGLLQDARVFSAFTGMTMIPVDLWETQAEREARLRREAARSALPVPASVAPGSTP